MTENTELQNKSTFNTLINYLNDEDVKAVIGIKDELFDNWKKKQIFRTDTEMRVSVLNDAKFPTRPSKYWQSVREMSAMFDALMALTFDIRENEVNRLRLEREMKELTGKDDVDELDVMELQIKIDRNVYDRITMLQVAHDRIRELQNWSRIKAELDDGSFDTQNVNTHQAESYYHYFSNRVKSLNESSAPGEIMNAIGPLQSLTKAKKDDGTLIGFNEEMKQLR